MHGNQTACESQLPVRKKLHFRAQLHQLGRKLRLDASLDASLDARLAYTLAHPADFANYSSNGFRFLTRGKHLVTGSIVDN